MKLRDLNGKTVSIVRPERFSIKWGSDSRSKFQTLVKRFLKRYWIGQVVFEEFPVPHTKMSLDIVNVSAMVAIEVQGAQHLKYSPHFHGNTNYKFLDQVKRDEAKQKFCDRFGIRLVEIYPNDVLSEELFQKQGVIL